MLCVLNYEVASFSSSRYMKNNFVTAAAEAAADIDDSIKRKRFVLYLETITVQFRMFSPFFSEMTFERCKVQRQAAEWLQEDQPEYEVGGRLPAWKRDIGYEWKQNNT